MQTNKTIVLASSNKGKLREIAHIFNTHFSQYHLELKPQADFQVTDAEETGLSFIENAILKARHASKATGFAALADDSGLSVDALDGAPGIYSARFAGENASDNDNIHKLLDSLKDVPEEKRAAQFHCVLAYVRHHQDPNPQIFSGTWQGSILHEPQGDKGFGYDPVFYCPQAKCAAAQLSVEQKQRLSHRGKALNIMAQSWQP